MLAGTWKRTARLPYWLPRGRHVSHQKLISGNVHLICLCQVRIRLPTLVLKPRGNVTRSPKQGHQWPHKSHLCPLKSFHKNFTSTSTSFTFWRGTSHRFVQWQGGVHGGGYAWQRACMAGGCMAGRYVWQGGMCGRGCAWQGACVACMPPLPPCGQNSWHTLVKTLPNYYCGR